MSGFTDNLKEPEARAAADVWLSLLIRYEGGSVWACSDLSQAHITRMFNLYGQLIIESMVKEAQARGLDEEAAWDDTGQLLHEHLDELELAMIERGWGVYPVDWASPGEPTLDNP